MLHRWGMEFVPSVIAVVMMGMGILPEQQLLLVVVGVKGRGGKTDGGDRYVCLTELSPDTPSEVRTYGTYLSGRSPATSSCLPLSSSLHNFTIHPTKKKKLKGYGQCHPTTEK